MNGNITISRPQGNECDYISIEIVDKYSRVRFLDVRVKYADFAQALTGLEGIPCEFTLRGAELVGMKYEHKMEEVYVPDGTFGERKSRAEIAVRALETFGWKGRTEDALNHHRVISHDGDGSFFRVKYSRHVDWETK